jgi:hypothetical protein
MHRLGVFAVVALAMLLSACGSSGGRSNASSSPTTTASTVTTAGDVGTTAGGAGTTAASGGISEKCPSASVVNAALAQNVGAPTTTQESYGVTCTYRGTGAIPTKIAFQQATASTFAAGEAAVPIAAKVSALGDAAYVAGGFLAVLKGTTALRITSPLSTATQVEALAHSILG